MFRVRLEDVSRQDSAAEVVAETEVVTSGEQVPIPFALEVDRSALDPRGAVRAPRDHRVRRDAALHDDGLHSTARGGRRGGARRPARQGSRRTLRGTQWDLVELDSASVSLAEGESAPPHLLLDAVEPLLSGSGGVNRLTGSFEQNGDELRLGLVATTMMAGAEPLMQRERAFVSALAAVTGYRIRGSSLELLDGERVVARLEAHNG